ncbi:MAG: hypothetical protein D6814_04820 [Calditrichaeota bacterium]|nr:MAG: hypothetical protein D6814_04820 [Calditrichota bacterium]
MTHLKNTITRLRGLQHAKLLLHKILAKIIPGARKDAKASGSICITRKWFEMTALLFMNLA